MSALDYDIPSRIGYKDQGLTPDQLRRGERVSLPGEVSPIQIPFADAIPMMTETPISPTPPPPFFFPRVTGPTLALTTQKEQL